MVLNIITTLNKNQLFTKNFPVEGIRSRVAVLKEWATYYIADGEEDNIKDVVMYGNDPAGTVVPFETRKETCETVSSLMFACSSLTIPRIQRSIGDRGANAPRRTGKDKLTSVGWWNLADTGR